MEKGCSDGTAGRGRAPRKAGTPRHRSRLRAVLDFTALKSRAQSINNNGFSVYRTTKRELQCTKTITLTVQLHRSAVRRDPGCGYRRSSNQQPARRHTLRYTSCLKRQTPHTEHDSSYMRHCTFDAHMCMHTMSMHTWNQITMQITRAAHAALAAPSRYEQTFE